MNYWLFPSNPKTYDAKKAFSSSETVSWHQNVNHIQKGDYVFIYVSSPSSKIELLCEVLETNIPSATSKYDESQFVLNQSRADAIKVSKLLVLKKVKEISIPLSELKSHGLKGNIQGQRQASSELLDYLMCVSLRN